MRNIEKLQVSDSLVTYNDLELLSLPNDSESSVIGNISKGSKIMSFGREINGYMIIEYKNQIGYISIKELLHAQEVEASIEEGAVYKGTRVELASPTKEVCIYYTLDGSEPTEWSEEYTSGTEIIINREFTVIKAKAVPKKKGDMVESGVSIFNYLLKDNLGFGKVKGNKRVNIRVGAGSEYEIIGNIEAGVYLELLEEKGSYYLIMYEGEYGYIAKSLIELEQVEVIKDSAESISGDELISSYEVTTANKKIEYTLRILGEIVSDIGSVYVYESADKESEIIGVLTNGDNVVIIEDVKEYYRIEVHGIIGCIEKRFVALKMNI